MYHNLFDSHTHSDNSLDGQHSAMYMGEYGAEAGLMGLAFTDHAECKNWNAAAQTRIVQSVVDAAKTTEAFRHRLSIVAGVEVGLTRDFATAGRIVELYPFDFVLGSVHQTRTGEEIYDIDYAALDKAALHALMEEYFEDMLACVEWGRFQALAHLNFPCRCAMRNSGLRIDLRAFDQQIDAVLRAMVQRGIALELNTSSLRGPLEETMPPLWVMKRYRELGGELVTIGSDAHRAVDLGAGIADGMALLEELGYSYFSFYRGCQPIMLRIV